MNGFEGGAIFIKDDEVSEMSNKNTTFNDLFDRSELVAALQGLDNDELHNAALRYYDGAASVAISGEQLTAVALLKDVMELVPSVNPSAELQKVKSSLADYHQRLSTTVNLLGAYKTVPKKMHFVWVGGAAFGDNQRDYFNIWKTVLGKDGYTLNIHYDPDALMAFDTNRILTQAAKADAMLAGGAALTETVHESAAGRNVSELTGLIEARLVVLKQQMFEHIQAARQRGQSADAARIDLLVDAYGQDRAVLLASKQRYLESHLAMAGKNVLLRDVRAEFGSHVLWDVYDREIAFRGNFAGASDVIRLMALEPEGGRYSDLDYLPALVAEMAGVNISEYTFEQRLGTLQLLLNHNPDFMPGRDRNRYRSYLDDIPAEHRSALEDYAKSHPSIVDVFVPAAEVQIPVDGLMLGRGYDTPGSVMNAYMLAHPESGMVKASLNLIRLAYDAIFEIEKSLAEKGALWSGDSVADVASDIVNRQIEGSPYRDFLTQAYSAKLVKAIVYYHLDGVHPEANGTVTLSGPGAVMFGRDVFAQVQGLLEGTIDLENRLRLDGGYNRATEEETISGWVEQERGFVAWLEKERANWLEGRYKARYAGQMSELLKPQTLTFKQGWPVIEGRPVMLNSILQRMLSHLGEPFLRAMNQQLSGDVTFDKPLNLSFDERQRILAQGSSTPPVSIGFEPAGNFNELISRIGHGSLPLEQLSPAHRVYLGGLFGAVTLDEAGFGRAWQQTLELAKNTADHGLAQRYIAIEQTLLSQNNPAFTAGLSEGLATFNVGAQDSRTLKTLAFAQPLTLRQWGEHIARIRIQADHELRTNIFDRSATVLETFITAGASTAKLMPQGLLIRGEGDPGRHCFPLVLAMAAALAKGPSAVDTLSGRLANANLERGASATHALLRVLDELRSVPMAESGTVLGASRLDQTLRTLEGKTATTTLMLNSESHSLLLAKVVSGDASSYRFYDPNFGVFGFEQARELRRGLEHFFSDAQVTRLYGIPSTVDATFNVIELDGSRIADKTLPSKINVASLLEYGPVSAGVTVAPWEHHAALRARALSENARLGRSLGEMDARHWAKQIEGSTKRLQAENKLGGEFVPVFESVREQSGGGYEISLVNTRDPNSTVRVSSTDRILNRIKSFLTETFQTLSVRPSIPGVVDPTNFSAVHSINAAYTVQALLMVLKTLEQTDGINQDRSLTTAVRMHGYLSYTQLAHGNVIDVVELVKLFKVALKDAPLVARASSSVLVNSLGHIARDGVATVLQLATVGFDIYLLANARDDLQRAQFGTQLAFDATGLALSVAGIGAGLAGAGTAAAFLGGAGVILGGLAVGVGALVEGFNGTLERGRQIGKYLNRVDRAYRTGGHSIKEGVFYPNPYAAIREIDLRNKRVTFDSQEILSVKAGWLSTPEQDPDRTKAINIRQHLGRPEHGTIADLSTFQTLVLPCVAKTYFGFDYSALPFATTRFEHFDTALKLEYDAAGERQFWFTFYSFPSEFILHNLYPVEVETTINIRLDEGSRSLLVPQLNKPLHGKLSYSIEGYGGHCALTLTPGIRLISLSNAKGALPIAWTLRAPWLGEDAIVIKTGRLTVGDIEIEVVDRSEVTVQTAEKTVKVDWAKQQLLFEELVLEPDADTKTLQAEVRALARDNRLASPFTAVQNFLVPYGDPYAPQRTTAYYEQGRDRFIYSRDLPVALAGQARLGAVIDQVAYFYAPQEALIWQVDVVTGSINRFYRLMDPVPGSSIAVFQDLGQGMIRIVQQVTQRNGREVEVIYLLGENEVRLVATAGQLTERQQSLMLKANLGPWSNFFWDYELLVKRSKLEPLTHVPVVDYQPAAFTSITRLTEGKKDPVSTWVRASDGLLIRPNGLPAEGPGGVVMPLLLTPATSTGDTFLFYDKPNQRLYRQKIDSSATGNSVQIEAVKLLNVVDVIANEGRYVAVTKDGLYFDISDQGEVQLAGLTEDWLQNEKGPLGIGFQWWKQVEALAQEHQAVNFTILGLDSFAGDRKLCAWYVGGRLLICDMGAGKVVRLLALTPDKEAAWLLDVSAGQVYRQAFLAPETLADAFGNDLQLLRADQLPAPHKEWAEWSFVQVSAHGAGLLGRTVDGLEVEMLVGEPARIVGVTAQWLKTQGSSNPYDEHIGAVLKALTARHRHAPFIQIGGNRGYHWYVSSIDRVLGESNTQLETRMLGVREAKTALLHEIPTRLSYSTSRDVWLENSVAQREAEVLSLQWQGTLNDLTPLIPDDVSTLILSLSGEGTVCRLSQEVWRRLESVIIDCRPALGSSASAAAKLEWKLDTPAGLIINLVDEHVVILDPDTGHSLILREANATDVTLRGDIVLAISGYQPFTVASMVTLLADRPNVSGGELLNALIA
ncbi:TcdA/TcdB pore-forming domain-containing protein [Pseudomonas prosekii]|uniref:Insecticidal toxin n=1 Tax=Pseudomonas prosekii TaxID=1148509 RepID=A0A1H1TZ42_9PSED|nr:TcdA/TcdB pore-forming domain-containing protein [Pseudomonas prosekii]SDS65334.1 insecticidal toxin [Pseudomonas prosekii]